MNLKIINLNLWQGGLLWDNLIEFLQRKQSDIYLFQEVYSGTDSGFANRFRTISKLADLFPKFYSYFGPFVGDLRTLEGLINNGNLILSKYPLKNQKTIYFDQPFGVFDHDNTSDFSNWPAGLVSADVSLPSGKVISVGNLHGPVWMDGSELTQRRRKMIEQINDWIKQAQLWILAGDSNAKQDNPCWQLLDKNADYLLGRNLTTTFNMKRKDNPGYGQAAVDIALLKSGMKGGRARLLDQEDVSDHLPIEISVEV